MLARRLRRRPNIKTPLRQCLVLAGNISDLVKAVAKTSGGESGRRRTKGTTIIPLGPILEENEKNTLL